METKTRFFPVGPSLNVFSVILFYLSTQKYAGRRAGTKIGRELNVDDLITCETKVQVVVSLVSFVCSRE